MTTAIDVTLEEIYFGAEKSIEIGFHQNCSICNGTGVIRNAICNNCDGRGLTVQTRKLRIKIPAGIHEGSKIRLTGSGWNRKSTGDLYLQVKLNVHQYLKLRRITCLLKFL